MASYADLWRPASEPEAQWQIDPVHRGIDFWAWGKQMAADLLPYRPATRPLDEQVVVDYGCGLGRVMKYTPGRLVHGVDASAEMLEMARQRLAPTEEGAASRFAFHRTTGASIPLPTQSADFVYSVLVLQHMDADDVVSVVEDTRRVLAPGGTCYLLVSAFGHTPFAPGAKVPRGQTVWTGSAQGSRCAGHDVLCYKADDVLGLGARAGFGVYHVEALHPELRLGYLALVASNT
jgi:SAM-dependent methyltransferase